jgi:hypothetical protein
MRGMVAKAVLILGIGLLPVLSHSQSQGQNQGQPMGAPPAAGHLAHTRGDDACHRAVWSAEDQLRREIGGVDSGNSGSTSTHDDHGVQRARQGEPDFLRRALDGPADATRRAQQAARQGFPPLHRRRGIGWLPDGLLDRRNHTGCA